MRLKTNKKINKKFNLNYKKDPVDKRDFSFKSTLEVPLLEVASTIPSSVDYTSKMGTVKEQGDLGSCVAFAVSAMKEYQERSENLIEIDLGKAGSDKIYDYSEAWIYWNAKKIDEWPGEEGTSIRYAMKVLQKIGVPTEKGWPYKDVGDIGEPERWANLVARWALIDSYYRVENVDELRIALASGPVPIGIPCFYEFFFVTSNGIVPYPKDPNTIYGGHAVCLSEDTKIPLLDGNEYTISQLSILYPEKRFWVYSCDDEGNIVPGLAHSPRKTGTKKVLKIKLDNGEVFKCTNDHKILCRNGQYVEAMNLKINDSIMPLYKKKGVGDYEMVFNPSSEDWVYTHKIMCNNRLDDVDDKTVVHHKNFNKYDNTPDNLQEMTWGNHVKLHAKYANPEPLIRYAKSDTGRNKSREMMNSNWSNEEFRDMMIPINRENGKKVSEKLVREGRCGFQNFSEEKMRELGHKNGLNNHIYLHTEDSHRKAGETLRNRYKTDKVFKEQLHNRAIKNLSEYNQKISGGEIKPTEKQINVRRENGKKLNETMTPEQKKLRALKTAYTRWYKDKFDSFKEFLEFKGIAFNNHRVVSIEECGFENVYDLTVEKYHNFAIGSGIFVHNCAVGYDNSTKLFKFKNSWGTEWGQNGYGYIPYQYVRDFLWDAWASKDLSVTKEMLKGTISLT